MADGARWPPFGRVYPLFEISPPLLRDCLIGLRQLRRAFLQDVQQDEEVAGSLVEDAIQRPTVVAAQLPKWSLDLRTEGKGVGAGCQVDGLPG